MGVLDELEGVAPTTPAPSGGRLYISPEPPAEKKPSVLDGLDTSQPPDAASQYGYGQTAAMHGVHGLTSGFSDEIAGFEQMADMGPAMNTYSAMSPIPVKTLYGLARLGYGALTGDGTALEEYKKARDDYRKKLEDSSRQNPITATVSDIGGSLAVPGGSLLKGASMGARALRGAGVGAMQGAVRGAGEAAEMENVPGGAGSGAIIGGALGGPLNAVLGPRAANPAQQAIKDIADKYGVQLPYYMVSDSPIVQFYGKGMDQLPFVGGATTRASERAYEGVKAIRDNLSQNLNPTEARKLATDAAQAAKDDFVDQSRKISDQNFTAVTSALSNPRATIMPTHMQTEAADQLNRLGAYGGSPGSVLNQVIQSSEAAIDRGGLTYEALKNLRTDLYRKYRTMEGRGGIDFAGYSSLLGAITKDMEAIVQRDGGKRAVDLWQKANAQHGIGKDMAKDIGSAIGKSSGDTAAADAIFRNINSTRPNIGVINTLRNTMRPSEWEKVQASVMARMGGDDAGNFSIQKFISANNKLSDQGRDAMFGMVGTPKRDAYDAVLKLGQTIQRVERFRNVSNTAPYILGASAALQLLNDYKTGNYFNTAGQLTGGAMLAAILARPATARSATTFAKVMDKALLTPSAWTAGKIPRAAEVAARNFAISFANSSGIDKDKVINAFIAPIPLGEE